MMCQSGNKVAGEYSTTEECVENNAEGWGEMENNEQKTNVYWGDNCENDALYEWVKLHITIWSNDAERLLCRHFLQLNM